MSGPALNGIDSIAWASIPTPWIHADPKPFDVTGRVRGMIGDDPALAEECFSDLRELFVGYYHSLAQASAPVVPFLVEILAHDGTRGRGYAGLLLAEIAALARGSDSPIAQQCLAALRARHAAIEAVARCEAGSHVEAARLLLAILDDDAVHDRSAALNRMHDMVCAEEGDRPAVPSLPPGDEDTAAWLNALRDGSIVDESAYDRERQWAEMAVYLSGKVRDSDPGRALELLETRRPPPVEGDNEERRLDTLVRWSIARSVLLSLLRRHKESAAELDQLTWTYAAQSVALSAAEHEFGSAIAVMLLEHVSDPSLRVRRRAAEARHSHRVGNNMTAMRQITALVDEWTKPAAVHGANQVLDRKQMRELVGLVADPQAREGLLAHLQAAPDPELALPEGDTI